MIDQMMGAKGKAVVLLCSKSGAAGAAEGAAEADDWRLLFLVRQLRPELACKITLVLLTCKGTLIVDSTAWFVMIIIIYQCCTSTFGLSGHAKTDVEEFDGQGVRASIVYCFQQASATQ
jgi:hypothetical protein